MKYCSKCGQILEDDAVYCSKCGAPQGANIKPVSQPSYSNSNSGSGFDSPIKTVAFIFMILGTIALGFAIIPLAWCIPMTVVYYNSIKNNQRVTVGFKVCALLFVNLIAGILMLVDEEPQH